MLPLDPTLTTLAERVVTAHNASPCAVIAAAVFRENTWKRGIGAFGDVTEGGPAACPATVFDLASVTKPFTALLVARLARRGIPAGVPLGTLLEEARGTPTEHISLELLLAHRGGLAGHRPLFAPLLEGREVDRAAALREAANARRKECVGEPPDEGFPPVYSDLGYLLVGEALSRGSGVPLAELVDDEVVSPLWLSIQEIEE